MRVVELTRNRAESVLALHESLKRELGFPEYYGENLDALNDCLGEITEPTRFLVEPGFESAIDGYGVRVIRVLLVAAMENVNLHIDIWE